jgi:hypothetical protein
MFRRVFAIFREAMAQSNLYTQKLKRKLHTLHKKEVLADIDVTIEILCCLHIHG